MSLGSAQAQLESDLKNAYYRARDDGVEGTDVIPGLALDVTVAVHFYMLDAVVTTVVSVDSGQSDTVGGSTSTSPPPGVGTGELS